MDRIEPGKVDRDGFKEKLKAALKAAVPEPKSEEEAERTMKSGGVQTSAALKGELGAQRDAAAGPMASAAGAQGEVTAASQPAPDAAPLTPEQPDAPPAPVSAGPVVPAPLPDQKLDYSADRQETDRAMAESKVTTEQLQQSNEPTFGKVVQARSEAEKREAAVPGQFRKTEAGQRAQVGGAAQQALVQGLGGIHGSHKAAVGKVAGQQSSTKQREAQKRADVTKTITDIKDRTRATVNAILEKLDQEATAKFQAGLTRAEAAYSTAFEDAKGGWGTWLTTWGDDWKEHIDAAFVTARARYNAEVDAAIDEVALFVEMKLKEAKDAVATGRKEIDVYVQGLDTSSKQYGEQARTSIGADFDTMAADIDAKRDQLCDKLAQEYKASRDRIAATEEKLREENKTLWDRVKDATIGVIKTILAFKDMLLNVLSRAAAAIELIISDPIGFLGNLVSAVMRGLNNFVDNILAHLKKGLMEWLFGALAGAGLQIPDSFDLKGIISLVLQVLGLTYANFRARAVAIVGEPIVKALESAAEVFKIVVTEGIPGLWRFIKEKLADLKSMVMDAIIDFVKEKVIVAGVKWLIGLLNPASAFIKACIAIYDIVMFFVNRGSQIMALVNAIIDSVTAIAKGNLAGAANWVEQALARAIPVAIGFLASLLGLGDISNTIRNTIKKVQQPVNTAIDWVINQAVKVVKAAGKLIGGAFKKKDKDKDADSKDPEHDAKVAAGLIAIDVEERKLQKDGAISKEDAASVAKIVRSKHPIFKTLAPVDAGDHWKYRFSASAAQEHDSSNKKGTEAVELTAVRVKEETFKPRVRPDPGAGWRPYEQHVKQIARTQFLPKALGDGDTERQIRWAESGAIKSGKRAKLTEVELPPEQLAQAMPKAGEPAQAFYAPRLPAEGEAGAGQVGSSKPDMLVLTENEIVMVEATLRAEWTKENVETGEAGGRLHKQSQAASLMRNIQPFLQQHPHVKIRLVFMSNRPPDKVAREALEKLANETYPGQISRIQWIIL